MSSLDGIGFEMPNREKKSIPQPANALRKPLETNGQHAGKHPANRISPAGNSTRINAFVSAQGRRNQAKRDAR